MTRWLTVIFSVMGVCPILFNMLQFWLIDSIVKAKEAFNLGSPDLEQAVDEAQAPLFADNNEDSDDESRPVSPRRRRVSRDLERGISPLKLSPKALIPPSEEPKPSTSEPSKEGNKASGSVLGSPIKRRSPPPSPAYGAKEDVPDDDDWNEWDDDANWDEVATDPWTTKKTSGHERAKSAASRSPKAGVRRLSLNRLRGEGSERTAWGMDVINNPGTVR